MTISAGVSASSSRRSEVLVKIRDRPLPAEPAHPIDPPGTSLAEGDAFPAEAIGIRAARIADMRDVEPLIRRFADDNIMLPKSFDQLARCFREFVVATDPTDRVVACGALRIYNEGLAEVCSLAVDPRYQGRGIGRRIVERLVDEARFLAITSVFALTLKPEFFGHLGFRIVPKETFPLKVWADCRSCPKLHACDEIAVALELGLTSGPPLQPTDSEPLGSSD
jgi:amino-acid N-acetyltransferase